MANRNTYKTHCVSGHPFSGENLIRYRNRRYCKICVWNNSRRYSSKRRELTKMLDFKYSILDEQTTRLIFDNQCFKCQSKNALQIDHNYPLSDGVGLSIDNAVLLCKSCNTSKRTKRPEEFYTQQEFEKLEYLLGLTQL